MKKNVLAKFVCLVLSLGVLSVSQAYAQTKTCDLQLEVIQNTESSDAKEILIKDAEANFVSRETKKVFEADLKEGMPYFAKLPEGQYRLSVTKKGHKTTIKFIDLVCSLADERGAVSEIIFLSKGDSKQTVIMSESNSSIPIKRDSQPTQLNSTSDPDEKIFQGGMVSRKAIKLFKPEYPLAARASRARGSVQVQLLISETGDVISARAVSGDPQLHKASEQAALKTKFTPTLVDGQPVKISGFIIYNFVPQ